jgi:hypothetical protein
MEEQKNLILLSNLSCYLMRYNYRIISRYDKKSGFYFVEFFSFAETKTSIESHFLCGCQSKNFDNVLIFVLSKIQKIIDR